MWKGVFFMYNENENKQENENGMHRTEGMTGQPSGEYHYAYRQNNTNQTPPPFGEAPKMKKEKKKGSHHWTKVVASALVFGLVAGAAFQGVNLVSGKLFGTSSGTSKSSGKTITATTVSTNASDDSAGVAETVAANCMPSIVAITNSSVQEVQSFFGGSSEQEVQSAGSGIIIGESDSELLIVTNYHVIADATTLTVTFIDEESVEASLKGGDSSKDIAVLAVSLDDIKDSTLDEIKVATIGDSDSLKVGETAIAIGNALNYGQSVTEGIISALNRTVDGLNIDEELIQTDAAINPGNSGGALLNASGELIGINVAKVSSSATQSSASVEAMGYAIPISDVKDLINELMNEETKKQVSEDERGVLGIQVQTIDSQTASAYNMPEGVYVAKVQDGSGAEDAGIITGDVITAVNGMNVSSYESLQTALSYYKVGEKVTVTIQRINKSGEYDAQEVEVTLGEQSK